MAETCWINTVDGGIDAAGSGAGGTDGRGRADEGRDDGGDDGTGGGTAGTGGMVSGTDDASVGTGGDLGTGGGGAGAGGMVSGAGGSSVGTGGAPGTGGGGAGAAGMVSTGGASPGTGGNSGSGGASLSTLTLLAGAIGGPGNTDGTGATARFDGPIGVAIDGAGNLFVTDKSNQTIRKVVISTGVVSTLAGSPGLSGSVDGTGAAARFSEPWGLASDGAGNLFVADGFNHTIRKVVVATGMVTTLVGSPGISGSIDGTGSAARFREPAGLALDGAGNLFVADGHNSTIRRIVIATGVVTTVAGSPGSAGGVDGTGAAARFNWPMGLAADGMGNLFVSDWLNPTIRKIVIATGAVTTIAGSPGNPGSADGVGAVARFANPRGLALNGAGDLFVCDADNNTVRKVIIATGEVTTIAGSASMFGSTDGTASAARFDFPEGLVSDGAGNLLVADVNNTAIRKVVIATGVVTTVAGSHEINGSTDATGGAARFDYPYGVASDGQGNLFVADSDNNTIRKIVIATGVVTTLAGLPGVTGSSDGIGAAARFNWPFNLVTDNAGNVFVADYGNSTIRKIVVATGMVTTLAGAPEVFDSTDGVGGAAHFAYPYGIAGDSAGNLFVSDLDNNTIRKVVIATGVVTTLAGAPGMFGSEDGTGAAARFFYPWGLAADRSGNLFVADSNNHTIRKVVIATGAVTTLAGVADMYGSADGSATTARFGFPDGLATDDAGNLFVSDLDNHAIRKIVIATGAVTTLVGAPGLVGVTLGLLPAALSTPRGLAVGPGGSLFVVDENAVLEVVRR